MEMLPVKDVLVEDEKALIPRGCRSFPDAKDFVVRVLQDLRWCIFLEDRMPGLDPVHGCDK